MGTIYVARSAELSQWASDVGQSKYIFKLGYTEDSIKDLIAVGWADFPKWVLLKKEDAINGLTEDGIIENVAKKDRMLDPKLYPRLRGTSGIFKIPPATVENHIVLTRALNGTEESGELKLKPVDFADYLIHRVLRGASSLE